MSTQARPQDYARAIYGLAVEVWSRQLRDVQEALASNSTLRAAVLDSTVPVSSRLGLLDAATSPAGLNEGVRKVVGTLLEAGHMEQLSAILAELERIAKPRAERRLARVTSAVKLTPDEQAAIQSRLTKKFGTDLEFDFDVDTLLIGGVLLRIGDQVIDGSVAGKLAAMRDRLTA